MNKKLSDPAKFEAQYLELLPRLERCALEMQKQLVELLSTHEVVLGFPIQVRVKKWESLAEKLQGGEPAEHLSAVQDLVGIRLILLFQKDIAAVQNIIKENLSIVKEYDAAKKLQENQFGYSSYHFVVTVPESWCSVPTLKDLRGMRAEIQVRTVAQHIWAEASHSLQYKSKAGVPPSILRGIYRVSALLETVDLEFNRVLEERRQYIATSRAIPASEPLNVDLLRQILEEMLPERNKVTDDTGDFSKLLSELRSSEITTIEDLQHLIKAHYKAALARDAKRVQYELFHLKRGEKVSGGSKERLESGAFYTHIGLVRGMLRHG